MTPNSNRNIHPVPRDLLDALVRGGAISSFQAGWIESIWPDLDQDAFAHPNLRGLPVHSRAVLEERRLRGSLCKRSSANKLER
jgi:hypothetical protein